MGARECIIPSYCRGRTDDKLVGSGTFRQIDLVEDVDLRLGRSREDTWLKRVRREYAFVL